METSDYKLLYETLSSRLPFGLIVKFNDVDVRLASISYEGTISLFDVYHPVALEHVKPYLRKLESMTYEEHLEIESLMRSNSDQVILTPLAIGKRFRYVTNFFSMSSQVLKYLNQHMFDYDGLIEKGIALEAKNEMYKIK